MAGLLDEPAMVSVLTDMGVDIPKLRNEINEAVSRIESASPAETIPTSDFQRTIQRAIESVKSEGRSRVELVDVLKFALRCRNPKASPL